MTIKKGFYQMAYGIGLLAQIEKWLNVGIINTPVPGDRVIELGSQMINDGTPLPRPSSNSSRNLNLISTKQKSPRDCPPIRSVPFTLLRCGAAAGWITCPTT